MIYSHILRSAYSLFFSKILNLPRVLSSFPRVIPMTCLDRLSPIMVGQDSSLSTIPFVDYSTILFGFATYIVVDFTSVLEQWLGCLSSHSSLSYWHRLLHCGIILHSSLDLRPSLSLTLRAYLIVIVLSVLSLVALLALGRSSFTFLLRKLGIRDPSAPTWGGV